MKSRTLPIAILAAAFLTLSTGPLGLRSVFAQEKPDVITLVPAPEWQMTSSKTVDASAVVEWGGDPAIEHEYGVTALTARTYRFGTHTANVLIEQTTDTSAAYGLLTFYRTGHTNSVAGMSLTSSSGDNTLMVRGPAFIRCSVSVRASLPDHDYRSLLGTVGGPPPSRRALEQLPAPLPSRGLVQGSEKYALGPLASSRILPSLPAGLIGFESGAEVQSADYALGADKLTLVAVNYPTPQIARTAFDSINAKLNTTGDSNAHRIECRRADTYVLITLNITSPAAANHFLDQFKVSKTFSPDQVTSEHSEAMQLVNLLFANAVLIVGLAIISLFGGLLIFASKRLARKWFANSAFVEGENGGFTILNLRWIK